MIVLLFLWVVLICWLMFLLFIKHSISMNGGIILGLMALVCEGRDLYKSVIKAAGAKNPDSVFVNTSLLKDDD